MADRPSWTGAVEVMGFNVYIQLHTRKGRTDDSFKTLAPSGEPVKQVYINGDGEQVARDECLKGVEIANDRYATLTPEAITSIGSGERSKTITARKFSPLSSVPFELAKGSYQVVPDPGTDGSKSSVNTLWNGLNALGLAYCTEVTMRAGSRDSVLVLWADDRALWAAALPYEDELRPIMDHGFEVDEKAAEVFKQMLEIGDFEIGDFDHSEFESDYRERRQEAINAVLAGEDIEVVEAVAPSKDAPDLMDALIAKVEEQKKPVKKGGKRKPAKKASKPKAKAAA